ncbi:MAG: YncE family protein [Planctomycetota bacterium]
MSPFSLRHLSASATVLCASLSVGASFFCVGELAAQGEFVNYEVGGVRPIATTILTAGGFTREVLFVCNTADDALEIYDAATRAVLGRVPTGLAPVTVRYDALTQRAYTCNSLGDSVTVVDIAATASGDSVKVSARLAATWRVGDEPNDLTFVPGTLAGSREAVVSLRSRSGLAHINLDTGAVLDGRISPIVDLPVGESWTVKNPRNVQFVGDRVYILDHQSGVSDQDIDLYTAENALGGIDVLTNPSSVEFALHDMGTTHANFKVNAAGDRMYVVGMRSTPELATVETAVGDLPTGFTQSWLWVVELNPTTGAPTTRPESAGVLSFQPSINLNRNYSNIQQSNPPLLEVVPGQALAQPTGLALVEQSGGQSTVVLTAFSSDKVAVLTPDMSSKSGWSIEQLTLTPLAGYSMAGPRDVVVDAAGTTAYVLCALDNSIRVVDITSGVPALTATMPLLADDTPVVVRQGREFLYGAIHSGNQMVSCSSCHIDGHTDALAWTLNQGHQGNLPVGFINGSVPLDWPGEKGPMITQTLRGLVNQDIEGDAQVLATNAPYHWRGDRADFAAFNGAFHELLSRPGGEISETQMDSFTTFVESIPHQPNPEQALTRRLGGSMGDAAVPESAYDPTLGSGSKRGLKIYHANRIDVSCAHCHALPEGSGNRATQTFTHSGIVSPVEPAALRHGFDREAALVFGPETPPATTIWRSAEGLLHDGDVDPFSRSFTHFIHNRFGGNMPTLTPAAEREAQVIDLTAFVRELDSGTAPIIGFVYTCDGSTTDARAMALFLDQVQEANAGIVAHTEVGGTSASYWYDLIQDRFRNDSTSSAITRASLLAFAANASDVVVLQAVPVGSARRIADYAGVNAQDSGPAPLNVTLEPMALPTHWEEGGDLRARWAPGISPDMGLNAIGQRESHSRQVFMQIQLVRAALAPTFVNFGLSGLEHIKHELPRRFRIAGDNIREGATLELTLPETMGSGKLLAMPLFPTHRVNEAGHRIWETTVEVDGELTLALLCGGPFLTNVKSLLDFTAPPAVNPIADNNYPWVVRNVDNTAFSGTSRLTIQHSR